MAKDKVPISKLIFNKGQLSNEEQLKKKIFFYSVAEGALVVALCGFAFFLFKIIVG